MNKKELIEALENFKDEDIVQIGYYDEDSSLRKINIETVTSEHSRGVTSITIQ